MSTLRAILSFILLSFVMLGLAACGSSGSGGTDPFASSSQSNTNTNTNTGTGTKTGPIFGNISTATGISGITLTTDVTSVDAANGQVLATAKVLVGGSPVPGTPVTFTVVAGPASVSPLPVKTDSTGVASTVVISGNALSTTNVILSATTTLDTQQFAATATFQVIRGTGAIKFLTTKTPTDPDGTLNTLRYETPYNSPATTVTFPQLIPFQLTDANGNPRVGVPITLDIYSQSGVSAVKIDFLKNGLVEPTANTVTTDSSGKGIFNIKVTAPVPSTPGFEYAEAIVYKGSSNDAAPLTAYGGFIVVSDRAESPPSSSSVISISPITAFFAKTDGVGAKIQFTISGGAPPYIVTASNPSKVSVALQADGATAVATLQDASLWSGWVSFSVTDKNGLAALSTPYIYRY